MKAERFRRNRLVQSNRAFRRCISLLLKNTPNLPLGEIRYSQYLRHLERKQTPCGRHLLVYITLSRGVGLRFMPIMTAYEQPSLPRRKERVSTCRGRKKERNRKRERENNTWYNHAALKPHIATMATERRIVVIVIVGCALE